MPDDPPPETKPSRHDRYSTKAPFIWWAIVVAILLIIGVWAVHNRSARDSPNQPAVTTAPRATGTQAQRPEETA